MSGLVTAVTTNTGSLETTRENNVTVSGGGTAVTTYYYRKSDGSFGSTTDPGSIPSGAVVQRIT